MIIEYKILETTAPSASEQQLNELGRDGWLLVTIVQWTGKWFYYFRREKPQA